MHINKARAASSADVPDDSPEQRPGQPAPTGAPQLQNASTGAPPAFFDAARSGDVGTLATLLATREARPTDVEPKTGMTALMLAVLRAQPSVVALLVDHHHAVRRDHAQRCSTGHGSEPAAPDDAAAGGRDRRCGGAA